MKKSELSIGMTVCYKGREVTVFSFPPYPGFVIVNNGRESFPVHLSQVKRCK